MGDVNDDTDLKLVYIFDCSVHHGLWGEGGVVVLNTRGHELGASGGGGATRLVLLLADYTDDGILDILVGSHDPDGLPSMTSVLESFYFSEDRLDFDITAYTSGDGIRHLEVIPPDIVRAVDGTGVHEICVRADGTVIEHCPG